MKVILYMAITPNGYIAKSDGDSEWTSREDLKSFHEESKKAGNVIIGKNTYEYASKKGFFPFPDVLNIVVAKENIENKWADKVLFLNQTPKEVLKTLEGKGFETAFLAGGGQLNSSFMKEGLVDEIYLDVEPLVFGKGIKLFTDNDFEYQLQLLDYKKLNENTIQLHYKVKK